VEVYGGSPALFATLKPSKNKIPLPMVSGGVNRVVAFLLAMASNPGAVVMIDEVENGIYYEHMTAIWAQMLRFMREYDCQLFVSTHSDECIKALLKAAGKKVDDITLWQSSRTDSGHTVRRIRGTELSAAVSYDEEVR
jgi:AAA15 family ATPase/GTPase